MYTAPLEERRRALENEFFEKENRRLMKELREKRDHENALSALGRACGLHDETILELLLEAEIDADSVVALAIVPLIGVGWANGTLEREEREAVLEAAHQAGVEAGSAASSLLEQWLSAKPKPKLMRAWSAYAEALGESVSAAQRALLRDDFVARASRVAEAAGGLLGVHTVSGKEREVIEEIGRAFG